MFGAIIGDIVGSVYEFKNLKAKTFPFFNKSAFFTDDTVMSIAVSNALIACKNNYEKLPNLAIKEMQLLYKKYPELSYGDNFRYWLRSDQPLPYQSMGNGAPMRISAVAYFAKTIEQVKDLSYKVTAVSHDHPEGIKGAEAVAVAVWLALNKKSKSDIKDFIEKNYYLLDFDYNNLKETYTYDESSPGTVPQAIYCFLISTDFEDAIRTAVSIGGDSDTLCAITGAIAEAFYGIPESIKKLALKHLDCYILKCYKNFVKKSLYKKVIK